MRKIKAREDPMEVPPKSLCDEDFAELSGELSGVISPKTPVLLGHALNSPAHSSEVFVWSLGFMSPLWSLSC